MFIGLSVALAGGLFTALLWRSFAHAREMAHWPEVECRILRSEVGERSIDPNAPVEYHFEVLYGFRWQEKHHTSERYDSRGGAWSGDRERIEKLIEKYPVGSSAICRVNPAQPEAAVLKPDSKAAGYSIWFPMLFVIGGLGIAIGAVRRRK